MAQRKLFALRRHSPDPVRSAGYRTDMRRYSLRSSEEEFCVVAL
ncbi:hypothetical protein [Streptomyces sp. cf386]|nr:hypothetical protein [Streptomyces sp. cf386]